VIIPVKKTIALLISFFLAGNLFSQRILSQAEFDSVYNQGLASVNSDMNTARLCLETISSIRENLTPAQNAKINFLRLKVNYSGKGQLADFEKRLFAVPDSLGHTDSLLYSARKYIERSMPDKAIPLVMQTIGTLPENSDQAVSGTIILCDAYREKQEYIKGISMLDELLNDRAVISDKNRAYAYNRLAALYDEWQNPPITFCDSVFKYSNFCIELSERINDKPDLAASQNELSYQYIRKKEYDKALELSLKSVTNFEASGLPYNAMNALINQSNIYIGKKEYRPALRVLEEATSLSPIEENRNLYMRLYDQFAMIYELTGKYREAYDFLNISYKLQLDFFKDRIDMQINEQSAKYDLLVKEQKIREEEKKNQFNQHQIVLLIIILVILCIAFILSIFYLRLKRKGAIKQKLIEAVADTEANERKRIARDLHDGLGPELSAINHYFQAYLDARAADKELIQKRLQQVISDAIDEVSRISHNISPYVLENHGLIIALNNFITSLSKSGGIAIDFTYDFTGRFDLKKELTIYRCITELLNNTIKHAEATKISLDITSRGNMLRVIYSDNGKGFDISRRKPENMGLYNIKNRVESFGGSLVIESSHKKGIIATIELQI
jgi:signal transduction histidine kinase